VIRLLITVFVVYTACSDKAHTEEVKGYYVRLPGDIFLECHGVLSYPAVVKLSNCEESLSRQSLYRSKNIKCSHGACWGEK